MTRSILGGFDQTLWLLLLFGAGTLFTTIFCLCLGRRARRATRLSGMLLLLCIGTFAYGVSTVSPSPETLFTEEFGTPPDSTITDLKAVRLGGAGIYDTYIQFHAPPTTIDRLFSGERIPMSGSVMGWDPAKTPSWWLYPQGPRFVPRGHGAHCPPEKTGHFGIRFR